MSSTASRGQHEVEVGYRCQCHTCHALRGTCPAFSFNSFEALMLHDVVIEPLWIFSLPQTPFIPFALSQRTSNF